MEEQQPPHSEETLAAPRRRRRRAAGQPKADEEAPRAPDDLAWDGAAEAADSLDLSELADQPSGTATAGTTIETPVLDQAVPPQQFAETEPATELVQQATLSESPLEPQPATEEAGFLGPEEDLEPEGETDGVSAGSPTDFESQALAPSPEDRAEQAVAPAPAELTELSGAEGESQGQASDMAAVERAELLGVAGSLAETEAQPADAAAVGGAAGELSAELPADAIEPEAEEGERFALAQDDRESSFGTVAADPMESLADPGNPGWMTEEQEPGAEELRPAVSPEMAEELSATGDQSSSHGARSTAAAFKSLGSIRAPLLTVFEHRPKRGRYARRLLIVLVAFAVALLAGRNFLGTRQPPSPARSSSAPASSPSASATAAGGAAPTVAAEDRQRTAALAAVRSYAGSLAPVRDVGVIQFDSVRGTAIVEALFENGARLAYVATRGNNGTWTVITHATPTAIPAIP